MIHGDYEYQKYIRLLSWQLLIESNSKELPVRITAIAKLYGFQHIIDYNETRWDNAKVLCAGILDRFGLNYSGTARKELAVKVLAPLCVLKKCEIRYPEDIVRIADIPYIEAKKRHGRLMTNREMTILEQEQIILKQFDHFIGLQRDKDSIRL